MSTNEPILPAEEPAVEKAKTARSIMMWASIIVAVIVIAVLLYVFVYRAPAINKGNEAIAEADRVALFENNDSSALALYEAVAADHGFDAGNRAKLQSAIMLYQKGDYEKALSYVEDYDATDNVVGALAYGLKGDCLVNLDKLPEAVKAFDKAVKQSDKNPQLVPYFLTKKAVVLSAEGNYKEAAEIYRSIEKNYPVFAAQQATEAHAVQAEAFAAAK